MKRDSEGSESVSELQKRRKMKNAGGGSLLLKLRWTPI